MDIEERFRQSRSLGANRTGSSWIVAAVTAILLAASLVVAFTIQIRTSTMQLGQVAGDTVVAQRKVTFLDRVSTNARRKQAMDAIPLAFRVDTTLSRERRSQADTFLAAAAPVLASSVSPSNKVVAIRKLLPAGVNPAALQGFPSLRPSALTTVRQQSVGLLSRAILSQFDENQIPSTESTFLTTLPDQIPPQERAAIGEVLIAFLAPTLVPDLAATMKKRNRAAQMIPLSYETIYPREVVVRRGDIVTPLILERLNALGIQSRREGWQDITAALLFASSIVAMLFWYLSAFHPAITDSPRLLLLVPATVLADVIGARLLTGGHVLLPLFLPAAAASTFAAALVAPEACVAIALAAALLAGWVVANSFELTTYYFVTSAAGVLAIRQVRQLKQFILAGASITAFGLVTVLAFGFLDRVYDFAALQEYVLAASFNGFVSSALALGAFALLSGFFGVTTMLQLLELGQPNQPLLRRLMVKAPGTYNHSLLLASMVEHAAEEIGANSLVAKLGALYHDVGKTANPHCFVENQLGMTNIHDTLPPEESARIIRNHVSHGLKLARQYHLPRPVVDAIAEHHGTMTISYFLHKARRENPPETIDPAMYTYPGPRPRSKETALLMLADGCEAAVRATADRSGSKIQDTVKKIIQERISHGQLDGCPLTLADLHTVQIAFCSVLNGLYHPRIEYPDPTDSAYHGGVRFLRPSRTKTSEPA